METDLRAEEVFQRPEQEEEQEDSEESKDGKSMNSKGQSVPDIDFSSGTQTSSKQPPPPPLTAAQQKGNTRSKYAYEEGQDGG